MHKYQSLNILKNKCDTYKNNTLKRRLLEDEAIFLANNKERLRIIWEKKNKEIDEINFEEMESSEEENSQSDFVAI